MPKHRDQAKFDRAEWRLVVLLPCWVAQLSLLIILIGISSYLLANAMKDDVEVRGTAIAWEGINIGVGVISVLLTGFEIVRTILETLTPKILLAANMVKLFGVILSMIMDGLVTSTDLSSWADGTFVIHSLLIISILALGTYASWKWRRLAEYDDYHLPGNVKPFGFKSDLKDRGLRSHSRVLSEDLDWDPDLEFGNTVEIVSESSPALMAPSPGEPSHPYTAAIRDSVSSFTKLAGRMNFSLTNDVDAANTSAAQRSRAGTASSLMASETAYDPVAQQMADPDASEIAVTKRPRAASYISVTGSGADRRISYNHTRDTSYEEYVREQKDKRRISQHISQGSDSNISSSTSSAGSSTPPTTVPASHVTSDSSSSSSAAAAAAAAAYRLSLNLKSEVDDALSAQFGWGSVSRSSSMDSEMASGQPPAIAVGGGAVKPPKNVRDSLGRAPSDGSEKVTFEHTSESSEDNGAEEEEEDDDHSQRTKENRDEAARALLGGDQGKEVEHPDLLRPGRPKSEAIAFVVTPPPKSPELGASSRMTWGSAYARN
ncbi:hypothetical protein N0V93_008479 [Gnomoniopsis smithogilvyi]|uniref:Uncharacterized protein n=1 Tax=Gnomoniopsis smithogilvyi TaxID=1191159 RepID=A0A9W8YN91_9PEZI|nr:hypothetical protein N0V93_008479 [Gnomoniopsis smithogilvyi]